MTTYKERLEKHEKAKNMLKREIDAVYYDEPYDEVFLQVSFGFGKEHEVTLASNKYCQEMCDVLTLIDAFESEKYVTLKEERKGFIGKPSYRLEKYTMIFRINNVDLREEVGWLLEEENWSEITKIFGGDK